MDVAEKLVRVRDVARQCGVCEKTIRRWIKAGRLPAQKLSPRTLRVVVESTEDEEGGDSSGQDRQEGREEGGRLLT